MNVYMYVYIYVYVIYIHTMEYYIKNEIMLFAATWVDLDITILSKSKSKRERQINTMISLICGN